MLLALNALAARRRRRRTLLGDVGATLWLVALAARAPRASGLAARRSARVSPELALVGAGARRRPRRRRGRVGCSTGCRSCSAGRPAACVFAALARQAAPGADQRRGARRPRRRTCCSRSRTRCARRTRRRRSAERRPIARCSSRSPPSPPAASSPAASPRTAAPTLPGRCSTPVALAVARLPDGDHPRRRRRSPLALAARGDRARALVARRHRTTRSRAGGAARVRGAAARARARGARAAGRARQRARPRRSPPRPGSPPSRSRSRRRAGRARARRRSCAGPRPCSSLYAASVVLVTPFQPGPRRAGLPLAELDVRQQGQALLSALWALAGVRRCSSRASSRDDAGAAAAARSRCSRSPSARCSCSTSRRSTSLYRVASFIALGLLLLAGAFAWQRIRPRPLPDLRSVPTGLR